MNHILNTIGFDAYHTDIVRGEGCYVYDRSNRRYVDFESGVWSTALGHNHPRVTQAITRQLTEISHLGYRYTHAVVEAAAAEVVATAGLADGKCIFLSSGSEAVELGVQLARRLSGQPLLLGLAEAYLAAYGSAGRRSGDEWYFFDWRVCDTCPSAEKCDSQCPHLQAIPFAQIGGFVSESGNSSGRVKLPPKGLVQTLAQRVKEHQGLIVANEVTTGFGRTGAWFGFQHYDLQPDIIAMGKGIGNGYPVSAMVVRSEIASQVEASFRYAQSHQNDAFGCAIAQEVIATMREEGLIERSRGVGGQFRGLLEQLCTRHSQIREVRGRGLMIAVEFKGDIELAAVHRELFERGFVVGFVPAANLFRFYPPLTIAEEDIAAMVEALGQVLGNG